jgi:nitronate monooxygenase
MTDLLERLKIEAPIIQAPMAGTSTPALAAAVSNAGALGSIAVGAMSASEAHASVQAVRAATNRAFNVNIFCHAPARHDRAREQAWLEALAPTFAAYGAQPPKALAPIYTTFVEDDAMLRAFIELRPPVVSFHFGLPGPDRTRALREAGCVLLSTATNLAEAEAAQGAGVDAVVAQGAEAGGHRGVFFPGPSDTWLGTMALTRLLVRKLDVPVIAAGGIMDGAGVAAALALGAVAAQLGTAFIACPESSADEAYRAALLGPGAAHTVMTSAISGRPARCLPNRFVELGERIGAPVPDYPIAYDAGKALNAAAKAAGESGYGAQWAGQGAPLARAMSAAALVGRLRDELREARAIRGQLTH